jgi:ABC-2 type transport system permease protein
MRGTVQLDLFRAEAARLWREPRLRWMSALLPALLVTVFFSSWQSAHRLASDRARFIEAERARWVEQGEKDPHSAAHFGVWAVKPSSALSVLAPGIEPFVGLAVWLEAHKRNEMIFRPQQDADPMQRSATSVAQLIELLGPVAAILLGFAGFAADRQRGTLRMALGNGVTPSRLLATRLVVMLAVLAWSVLLPAAALGAFAVHTLPDAGWNGWLRLMLWSLLQFLYMLSFLLMALAVSLRASSARAALTVMLVLWIVLCIVLPRAASNAAQLISPLPSYQEIRARAELEAPAYENAEQWEARLQSVLKAHGVANEKDAPLNVRGALLDQSERDSHAVFDRLLGRFYDAVETQDRTFGWLGALTPTVALQASASAVAGTDFHQHRHFIDAAESYRRTVVNRMNSELMQHYGPGSKNVNTGRQFWEDTPAFGYQAPALRGVIAGVTAPLLLLLAWCGAAGLAAWLAARGLRP